MQLNHKLKNSSYSPYQLLLKSLKRELLEEMVFMEI
jgi:hypothetical protein